jgi:hypothetical protein
MTYGELVFGPADCIAIASAVAMTLLSPAASGGVHSGRRRYQLAITRQGPPEPSSHGISPT